MIQGRSIQGQARLRGPDEYDRDATVRHFVCASPQWHDHDYHGHVVQFYSEDEFLVDAISRFLGESLAAGDAAIVLATKTHRERIARKLKDRGLDVTSSELKAVISHWMRLRLSPCSCSMAYRMWCVSAQ